MPEDQKTTNTGAANGSTDQSQSGAGGTSNDGTQNTNTENQSGNKEGTDGTEQKTGGDSSSQSGGTETIAKTPEQIAAEKVTADAAAAASKSTWPADWRAQLAGDDKTFLAQLERYASPNDLARQIREQDKLISSGQIKQPLPKDATPEQLAAYRKENGIPETADKYDLTLPDGLVIGEQDKPIINNMLVAMHGMNLSPDNVKGILSAYYQNEAAFTANREKEIGENKQRNDDMLHKEWGDEYRNELTRVNNLLATFSMDTQAAVQNGTGPDGLPFLNNINFLRDMAVLARIVNPVSTITPAGGGSMAQTVDDEIKSIEARMTGPKEQVDAYYKDEKAQARLRELYAWKDNQPKTGKAA